MTILTPHVFVFLWVARPWSNNTFALEVRLVLWNQILVLCFKDFCCKIYYEVHLVVKVKIVGNDWNDEEAAFGITLVVVWESPSLKTLAVASIHAWWYISHLALSPYFLFHCLVTVGALILDRCGLLFLLTTLFFFPLCFVISYLFLVFLIEHIYFLLGPNKSFNLISLVEILTCNWSFIWLGCQRGPVNMDSVKTKWKVWVVKNCLLFTEVGSKCLCPPSLSPINIKVKLLGLDDPKRSLAHVMWVNLMSWIKHLNHVEHRKLPFLLLLHYMSSPVTNYLL